MAGSATAGSTVPSLPPPCPKSPPECPDLYGRRREMAKLQILERERGILEEELKFVEALQPASRCCKEIVDFVTANADPLIPTNRKISKSYRLWKWFCGFKCSWICCCCSGCTVNLKAPQCCCCNLQDCHSCVNCCSLPKCNCWCNPFSSCNTKNSCCHGNCCTFKAISCFKCCCTCKCKCFCPKCSHLCACFSCIKNSCCCPSCCICC